MKTLIPQNSKHIRELQNDVGRLAIAAGKDSARLYRVVSAFGDSAKVAQQAKGPLSRMGEAATNTTAIVTALGLALKGLKFAKGGLIGLAIGLVIILGSAGWGLNKSLSYLHTVAPALPWLLLTPELVEFNRVLTLPAAQNNSGNQGAIKTALQNWLQDQAQPGMHLYSSNLVQATALQRLHAKVTYMRRYI